MERIQMGPIGQTTAYNQLKWDEKGHNVISHINVSYQNYGVTSIQFVYVENGALVMSKTYGSSSELCSKRILRLNHESEFVTGISIETYSGYITSLTFHTNQRTHEAVRLSPPCRWGKADTNKMELHSGILERREFGGFFGSANDDCLTFIGFYVTLVLPDVKKIKKEEV